jgi:hypothetical protein
VTFGFLTHDTELFSQAIQQVRIELLLVVDNEKCQLISAPSIYALQHVCTASAAMELVDTTKRGVLTPAQALLDTTQNAI